MAPLNLLHDCHFYASADEDSSEIQFYLVFQPVGTSELVPFIPADLILSLSTVPFSWSRCTSSPSWPFSTRSWRYFCSQLTPLSLSLSLFLPQPEWKIQAVYKEKRINMVECKIKFIPLQISVISLTSRDSYIFVAIANPRDFDVFSNNWRRY